MKFLFVKLQIVIFLIINTSCAIEKIQITVNQFVSHVALDSAYNGLIDSLNRRNILPDNADLIVSNSQGNISNSVQISKYHASIQPDFMVAISTPSAQTTLKSRSGDSVLAFVAVTDPEAVGLDCSKNVIGVSDSPPIKELVDIAEEILPNFKTVGVIYNSGEMNSVKNTEILDKILTSKSIILKKVCITNSSDVKNAMNNIIDKVDVIYLPQDNSVISALDSIANIAKSRKTPIIANDPDLVDKGVLFALGTNYFKSGQLLGEMISDLIEKKTLDKNIQDIAVKKFKFNDKLVKEFSIKIPENIKSKEDL